MNRAYLVPDIERGGPIIEVGVNIDTGETKFLAITGQLTPDPDNRIARMIVRAYMR